ncbi:MAG: zinc-finger domain-containing protein [Pseudomonadota bacterium]
MSAPADERHHDAPETEEVTTTRIACDGGEGALGHPRVYLTIGPEGWIDCPYCDKRYILKSSAGRH